MLARDNGVPGPHCYYMPLLFLGFAGFEADFSPDRVMYTAMSFATAGVVNDNGVDPATVTESSDKTLPPKVSHQVTLNVPDCIPLRAIFPEVSLVPRFAIHNAA